MKNYSLLAIIYLLASAIMPAWSCNCGDPTKVNMPESAMPSTEPAPPYYTEDTSRLPATGSLRPGAVIPSTTTYGVHTPGGSIPRINVPNEGGLPGTLIPGTTVPNVTQPEDTFPQILPQGTTVPGGLGKDIPY